MDGQSNVRRKKNAFWRTFLSLSSAVSFCLAQNIRTVPKKCLDTNNKIRVCFKADFVCCEYPAEFFSPFYLKVGGTCLGFTVGGLVFASLFLASEQKELSD